MKKGRIRSFFTILMIAASVCAYFYINNVDLGPYATESPQGRIEGGAGSSINDNPTPEDQDQPENLMPDVELIKSIIEKGKENLPALNYFLSFIQ